MVSRRVPGLPIRVVQWATGNIGTRALRSVIAHPHMELVGLYVHSENKVGKDAGELCGLPPVGVTATNSIEDILALHADCVLYMQQWCNFDDICRILASGKNIVTTRFEFHNPRTMEPSVRRAVDNACQRGQASIYSTGSSPGFITEALPLVLASIQRRLDSLTIDEFADLSRRDSADMIFNVMGFGRPPSEFAEERMADIKEGFAHSLNLVADAISMPLDRVDVVGEVATAKAPTALVAGMIEAGTVAAQRITISGMRNERPLLRFRANWYCTRDIEPAWQLGDTGWRIVLEGDAPLEIDIRNAVPVEQIGAVAPNKTPNRAVNAVPFVCAAPPGIRTTVDLPQVIPFLG
ncbi:hypothetical protein LJR219_005196 [Phenylobacterium sp. LjRoot219]|uniref:NAD(P)H-dependent amine dehydrogenase family protein n=1 Tax=Phenylobacterium sp. LjRoot219 TaxID=3342283 RepID=UPI003ECDE9C2